MQKKLTLTMDQNLIDFAHRLAKKTNQSISKIVAQYLKSLQEKQKHDVGLSTDLADMYGIFENNPLPDKKKMRNTLHAKSYN